MSDPPPRERPLAPGDEERRLNEERDEVEDPRGGRWGVGREALEEKREEPPWEEDSLSKERSDERGIVSFKVWVVCED